MGKAAKWFRGLLGLKKSDPSPNPTPHQSQKSEPHKKKWSFAKSNKEKDQIKSQHGVVAGGQYGDAASKQAMVIAAATARVAEAAVAAAHAAAAAVKHPSSGRSASAGVDERGPACVSRNGAGYGSREEWAAVTIQSHFRAYLSRRALRALKSLVKLQALVKGHLVRKQTAYTLRRLQALVRAQTRARAGRVLTSESPYSSMKSAYFNYSGPATPEKFEQAIQARKMRHDQSLMLKRSGSNSNGSLNYDLENSHARRIWMDARTGERLWEQGSFTRIIPTDNERTDKILEVDTGKCHANPKRKNLFHSCHLSLGSDQNGQCFSTSKDSTAPQTTVVSASSGEVQSLSTLKFAQDADESTYCTADNSPQFYPLSSAGSKRGSFTPTKSDCSRSCLSGYSDHPNYMAYTESSKAKVRSLSAPKQRPLYERSSSTKRYSVHGYGDPRAGQRVSALHATFTNKAYPGSGRLDRLGMPVRADIAGFSGGHWHRY